jgi:predicted amidohydrolase YtcJ
VSAVIPPDTEADQLNQARAALAQMRKSGITTFMDAAAGDAQGAAFTALQKSGELTARAFFAIQIAAEDAAADPAAAVAAAATLANTYDQGEPQVTPGIRFRHLKLFGDGVVNAPADTGGLLTPYFTNAGTDAEPNWVPGTNTGADYFPPSVLNPLMAAIASSGFDPHVHATGEHRAAGPGRRGERPHPGVQHQLPPGHRPQRNGGRGGLSPLRPAGRDGQLRLPVGTAGGLFGGRHPVPPG